MIADNDADRALRVHLSIPMTIASPAPSDRESPLILIAEDNEDNRFLASTMLQHAGYRMCEAHNGATALDVARAERPALILMDVGMPDIDGWTVVRTLKQDDATRSIIILAFTAHTLPSDVQDARDAGCDGFLMKPIAITRLVDAVAAALAGRAPWVTH